MKYNNIAIKGMGKYLPEDSITSLTIEERLKECYDHCKLPEGRLELMTGIQERRVWPRGTRPSDLSTKAAQDLFKSLPKSFNPKEDIDLLIHASVCRDFLEPSTASVVHANLGLSEKAMIFDLSNACLGVINALVVASDMIEKGSIKNALIVSGENSGPLLEETISQLNQKAREGLINRKTIKKYIANLTIGSAATAILVGQKNGEEDLAELVASVVRTDSSANVLCQGDGSPDSLMMETDSEALMEKGVALASNTWTTYKEESGWNVADLAWVLTHQVGKAHEALTLKTLGCEEVPTFRTYPYLGNTGSSALPITLEQLMSQGQLRKNQKVALMGIGSGLTSIILGINWLRDL